MGENLARVVLPTEGVSGIASNVSGIASQYQQYHHPETSQICTHIVNACAEAKAKDITALCMKRVSDMFEYFIIVSGRSDRQVQGITNRILESLKAHAITPLSVEGLDKGHWVVLDCDEVVVHVFYEPVRTHYDLESLWAGADPMAVGPESDSASLQLQTDSLTASQAA